MYTIRISTLLLSISLIIGITHQGVKAAVDLVSFTAVIQVDSILIEWETATEIDNAGFYLTRSTDNVPPYEDISGFIPAEGSGVIGAQYQFVDDDVSNGVLYYYALEVVDTSQNIDLHGPISVTFNTQSTITPSATLENTSTPTRTPRQRTSTPTQSRTPTKTRTPIPSNTATLVPPTPTPTRFTETTTSTITPSITPSPTLIDAPQIIVVQPSTNTPFPTVLTATHLPSIMPTEKGSLVNLVESRSLTLVSALCLVILLWAAISIGVFIYIQKRNSDNGFS